VLLLEWYVFDRPVVIDNIVKKSLMEQTA
jgi:hypothetical protein